ncbi:MAG: SRPBCC family protein [Gammaproteobacteria bacterium]|nr:SRPBCC family protein [Gammaproteobacteria bacterium]
MKKWLVGLLIIISVAHANDIAVEVSREGGNRYIFNMQFLAHAPAHRVHAIITDYNNLTQLNPLIKKSRILPHDVVTITRVELVTEGCMLFFCKKIIRVEDAQVKNNLTIETTFVPELSNFKSGYTRWTFTEQDQSTFVNYQASMVPDFWLPPFVGPYMLKQQLRTQLRYTANKINSLLSTSGK